MRKLVRACLVLALILLCVAAPDVRAAVACPLFGAHRGVGYPRPNTEDGRPAVLAAVHDPAAWFVEDDVRPTSDGQGIMNHDETWNRTSNATGATDTYTLAATLKHIRLNDGSVPMTVTQYVRLVRTHRFHALLHVKAGVNLANLARVLNAQHAQQYLRVMANHYSTLVALRDLAPHYLQTLVVGFHVHTVEAKAVGSVLIAGARATTVVAAARIVPYFRAKVAVDYVSNDAMMDRQMIKLWRAGYHFGRVLAGSENGRDGITRSRAALGCT